MISLDINYDHPSGSEDEGRNTLYSKLTYSNKDTFMMYFCRYVIAHIKDKLIKRIDEYKLIDLLNDQYVIFLKNVGIENKTLKQTLLKLIDYITIISKGSNYTIGCSDREIFEGSKITPYELSKRIEYGDKLFIGIYFFTPVFREVSNNIKLYYLSFINNVLMKGSDSNAL